MRAYSADDGWRVQLDGAAPACSIPNSNSGVQPLPGFRFAAPIDFYRRRRVHHVSMVHPLPAPMAWLNAGAALARLVFNEAAGQTEAGMHARIRALFSDELLIEIDPP